MTRDSVTLSWRPPRHDGGSKIKGYIVQKKKKGDADWSDANISPVPNTLHTVSFVLLGFTHFQLMSFDIVPKERDATVLSLMCYSFITHIFIETGANYQNKHKIYTRSTSRQDVKDKI